jgi:hypothetical protein
MNKHSKNTPQKHAALIKLWADGAEIQYKYRSQPEEWRDCPHPGWHDTDEYRIKPKKEYPKSDFTDDDLQKILRINRGICESITMARIIADEAIKRYIMENEE